MFIKEAVENPVMDFFKDMKMLEKTYNKIKGIIVEEGFEIVPAQNRLVHMQKDRMSDWGGITLYLGISNKGATTVDKARLEPQDRSALEEKIRNAIDNGKFGTYVKSHDVEIQMSINTLS
jgi:hypothetical protein